MSGFTLKLLALLSMVIDHSSHVLWSCSTIDNYRLYLLMRGIGRLAMPIYAFLLVKGLKHTKDAKAYLKRLMLFALLSQIPFTLCFAGQNYLAAGAAAPSLSFVYGWEALLLILPLAVYAGSWGFDSSVFLAAAFLLLPGMRLSAGDYVLLNGKMNVFYTLTAALAMMLCAEGIKKAPIQDRMREIILCAAAMLPILIVIQPHADYALRGILLILMLYACEEKTWTQTLSLLLWSVLQYMYDASAFLAAIFAVLAASELLLLRNMGRGWQCAGIVLWASVCCALTDFTFCVLPVFAALAACPMIFYNGKQGKRVKTAFYAAYPVHLCVLFAISTFL